MSRSSREGWKAEVGPWTGCLIYQDSIQCAILRCIENVLGVHVGACYILHAMDWEATL
jgi:hypothetical protein